MFVNFLKKYGFKLIRAVVVALLLGILMLLWLENTLIFPAPRYPSGEWDAQAVGAEDVWFASEDKTKLHGFYFDRPEPRAIVLYCHGNGDCVGYNADYIAAISAKQNISILSFDYRGYGRSEGRANEAGVLADARAARDWLATRAQIPPGQVVLWGRSIGGGVAVDLAADGGARGLILQNTFTTLPDVAAGVYWFLPVRMLMRTKFDSLSKIGRYHGPLLQSHGTADGLIPYAQGQKLFAAANEPKEFFSIRDGHHNESEPAAYYEAFSAFLDRLQ